MQFSDDWRQEKAHLLIIHINIFLCSNKPNQRALRKDKKLISVDGSCIQGFLGWLCFMLVIYSYQLPKIMDQEIMLSGYKKADGGAIKACLGKNLRKGINHNFILLFTILATLSQSACMAWPDFTALNNFWNLCSTVHNSIILLLICTHISCRV